MMTRIFVYGTLQTGFHNHYILKDQQKGQSNLLCKALTVHPYPLVVATDYNIPFMLDKKGAGKIIQGEVYDVDQKMLEALDQLENHPILYERTPIEISITDVASSSNKTIMCGAYLIKNFQEKLLDLPLLSEYTGGLKYMPPSFRPRKDVLACVKK